MSDKTAIGVCLRHGLVTYNLSLFALKTHFMEGIAQFLPAGTLVRKALRTDSL